MGSVPTRGNRNSDGWQKCFTNVPLGASRVSADHNVKNVFSGICDAVILLGSNPVGGVGVVG